MLIRNGASEARNEDGGGIEEVPLHVPSLHLERRDWPGRILEGVFEDDEAEVVVCNQTAAMISRAVIVQLWGPSSSPNMGERRARKPRRARAIFLLKLSPLFYFPS